MRKILILINLFLALVFFSASAKAEIDTSKVDEATSIESDLSVMNLTYSDYILSKAKYDILEEEYLENDVYEQYVIAVAENYGKDSLQTYIYCYSPLMFYKDINVQLDITLNDASSRQFQYNNAFKNMELIKSDKSAGIIVFSLELYKLTNFVRSYKIDINDSGMDTFECNYRTTMDNKDRCDSFNYNSLIYIEDDIVQPVKLNSTLKLDGIWKSVWNNFTQMFGGENSPLLFFYNFSTDKKIDEIISCEVRYNRSKIVTEIWKSFYPKGQTITPDASINRSIEKGAYSYTWGSGIISTFDYFKTPCTDRFSTEVLNSTEFYNLNNIKYEDFCMSKATGKEFQHSILFDVQQVNEKDCITYTRYTTYKVEDFRLTKLKFKTDGKIYSSIVVDENGGNDSEPPINGNKPEDPFEQFKTWLLEQWNKFGDAVKENISNIAGIVIAIIVGILLIVALFKYGIGLVVKIVWLVIKLPFKIAWWLIKLPFIIIFGGGGKKNG